MSISAAQMHTTACEQGVTEHSAYSEA